MIEDPYGRPLTLVALDVGPQPFKQVDNVLEDRK